MCHTAHNRIALSILLAAYIVRTDAQSFYVTEAGPDFNTGKIEIYDVAQNNLTTVVTYPIVQTPYTVTIDNNAGRIYWGDDAGFIKSSDLGGGSVQTVLTLPTLGPNHSIAR